VVDVDIAADGRGDGGRVAFVGGDDEVAAPEGAVVVAARIGVGWTLDLGNPALAWVRARATSVRPCTQRIRLAAASGWSPNS
jgi:hypothetical protein